MVCCLEMEGYSIYGYEVCEFAYRRQPQGCELRQPDPLLAGVSRASVVLR